MARYTTFRFCLDPAVEQSEVLARHGGASRFAFNQCLRMVKTALTGRKTDPSIAVPWTGFDLINAFNAWKKTADAGRVFTVDSTGVADTTVTGLPWRREVCQQVFEEAAVDLGKGLSAWSDSRRPGTSHRFGCATSNPKANQRRSASARTRPGRSRCPASGRSRCMTTPADYAACSTKTAPKSCSPPSVARARRGNRRSHRTGGLNRRRPRRAVPNTHPRRSTRFRRARRTRRRLCGSNLRRVQVSTRVRVRPCCGPAGTSVPPSACRHRRMAGRAAAPAPTRR